MKALLLFLLGLFCLTSATESLDGLKVFRIWPKTEEQRDILRSLGEAENLDFWSDVTRINLPVDVMVKPQYQSKFIKLMKKIGLEISVFINNVEEVMKNQIVEEYSQTGMTWTAYYKLEDIYAWFDDLAIKYPNVLTVINIGSTFEGRDIKGVKISFGSGKKAVFLEGGIHAREWISPATVTYIINQLLTNPHPDFVRVADSFDWYIFPVANPDGYAYSHSGVLHRLWRKTRTNYSSICKGADPNRNWDAYWGEYGTSSICLSETYGGPKPFSEKCVEHLSQYIRKVAPNMVAYFTFHAYTQLLMVPYGHTTEPLDNYNETVAIAKVAAEALASKYGTQYKVGNIAETIYRASGSSLDWVKKEFKTPLAYVYELRDLGQYGFLLPSNQIIPNCEEVVDSIVAIFLEAEKMGIVSLV